jgi:uncharacterized protein YkwD
MGGGASVAASTRGNEEDLIQSFLSFYAENPSKADRIIEEGKKLYRLQQAEKNKKEREAISKAGGGGDAVDEFNVELVKVLNFARTDPLGFSEKYLDPHLKRFIDDLVYTTTDADAESVVQRVRTTEGRLAVIEAIGFCKQHAKLDPKPELTPNAWLARAAQDHVDDIGATGSIEHSSADGSSTADRVSRHCVWTETVAENIDFGNSRPADIVVALIIDDGTPSRGHRTNIFNPTYRKVGAALGPHKGYKYCCVMDFAGGCKDLNSVVREDTNVMCVGAMSAEFRKVLFSIPGNQCTELCLMLEEKLAKNNQLVGLCGIRVAHFCIYFDCLLTMMKHCLPYCIVL